MKVTLGSQEAPVEVEMDEVAYDRYRAMSRRVFEMNGQIARLRESISELNADVVLYKGLHAKATETASSNLLQYLEAQRKLDLLKAIINDV